MSSSHSQAAVAAEWEESEEEALTMPANEPSGPTSPSAFEAASSDDESDTGPSTGVSWWGPLVKSHAQGNSCGLGVPEQNRPLLLASACCGCCAEAEVLKAGPWTSM